MQFKTEPRDTKQKRQEKFAPKDVEIAMNFAKKVTENLGGLVSAVVLFGSSFRRIGKVKPKTSNDVDILLILDDVRIKMTPDVVQTYRIIVKKTSAEIAPERLHIQILHLTAWWGYVRAGDPVATTILRDGFALVDTGWFDPLQALLDDGRIRPSEESIWTYLNMADASLFRSKDHILGAVMDLYWSVIDSAHSAIMSAGEIPQAPKHVADMLRKSFVKEGKLDEKYAKVMEMFYHLSKEIVHKKISEISAKDCTEYSGLAEGFVKEMKRLVKENLK